jgi:hypothetical protein
MKSNWVHEKCILVHHGMSKSNLFGGRGQNGFRTNNDMQGPDKRYAEVLEYRREDKSAWCRKMLSNKV